MKTHTTHILRARRFLSFGLLVAMAFSFPGIVEASTWSPTLLVNTESFQTIDDGDGASDIELRFGDTLNERFYWDFSDGVFRLTDDLNVEGNLSSSGTLSVETLIKTDGNLTINSDQTGADAILTFGNDSGNETITFNDTTNEFDISDDVNVTGTLDTTGNVTTDGTLQVNDDDSGDAQLIFGNDAGDESITFNDTTNEFDVSDDVNVTGTFDTTGNITTDANLTINEDNGGADAVLTFGNDAGTETFTFSDSSNNFELSDDLDVTGTVNATGNITTDANLTINEDNGAVDAVLTFGSDGTAETLTFANTADQFELSDDLDVTGTISGSTVHAQDLLTSSGGLAIEGAFTGATTFHMNSLIDCNGTSNKLTYNAATGLFSCETDQTGAGAQWTDGGDFLHPADNSGAEDIIVGANTEAAAEIKLGSGGNIRARGTLSGYALHVSGAADVRGALSASGALSVESTTSLQGATTITSTLDTTGNITTDANLTINEDNGGADAVLTFGNDGGTETFTFSDSSNNFELSDDLDVTGTVNATGNITTDANLTINEDNGGVNAVLTFGNDSGAETITFNDSTNEFDVSDDVNVTGTFDTTGNITTDANLTINEDNGAVDAVLTFGSDGTAETLTWLNTQDIFQFSDDVNVTGQLSASGGLSIEGATFIQGAATFGSTTSFGGVTYTWPGADGSSGTVLTTDGAGNLNWTSGIASSGSIVSLHPEYPNAVYVASGSTAVGALTGSGGGASHENVYHWTSSKSALNDYWVSTRVRIPNNFVAWDPTAPIEFRYRTGSSNAANNVLKVVLRDTANALVSLSGNEGLANTSFTTATITGPESAGTYTKGDYITLFVKLGSNSSGWAEAGFIELNWETRD